LIPLAEAALLLWPWGIAAVLVAHALLLITTAATAPASATSTAGVGIAFAAVIATRSGWHVAPRFERFAATVVRFHRIAGRGVMTSRRSKVLVAIGQAVAKLFASSGGFLEGVLDGRPRGRGFGRGGFRGTTLHHFLRDNFATPRPRGPLRSSGAFFRHALFPT
jgi:hypothetical protein